MTRVALFELPYFARNILAMLMLAEQKESATVVALRGELGAGKTTFTQTLARELGVVEPVQSPTYVLMKSYPLNHVGANTKFNKLVHIDAYRLEKPEEFDVLKPQEFLKDPHTLVLIEWPERVGERLPAPDLTLTLTEDGSSEERDIEVV